MSRGRGRERWRHQIVSVARAQPPWDTLRCPQDTLRYVGPLLLPNNDKGGLKASEAFVMNILSDRAGDHAALLSVRATQRPRLCSLGMQTVLNSRGFPRGAQGIEIRQGRFVATRLQRHDHRLGRDAFLIGQETF
jgi:hypothetical protein